MVDLKLLGKMCKKYRIEIGYLQSDVAKETGYTSENISSFETGRNDNAKILLWYLSKGLDYEYIKRGLSNGKKL